MTEMSPEVRQALEEQKKNCIFCKIIKGDMPSKKIFEDDLVFGVLDINPACKGHILLMPKEHFPIMPFLPPETFKRLFQVAQKLISSVKKGIVSEGSTLFIANGFAAGQQSQHFMIHLIPRDRKDGLPFTEIDGNAEIDPENERIIRHNLPIMVENHLSKHPAPWHAPKEINDSKEMTKTKVIQIVEQNPPLKDLILTEPQEFLKAAKTHPQLKPLFENIDPAEIVNHFNPDAIKTVESASEGGFDPPDMAPDEYEPERMEFPVDETKKGIANPDQPDPHPKRAPYPKDEIKSSPEKPGPHQPARPNTELIEDPEPKDQKKDDSEDESNDETDLDDIARLFQ